MDTSGEASEASDHRGYGYRRIDMASRAGASGHDEQCQEDYIRDSDVCGSLGNAEVCYRGIDQSRKIT